MSLHILDISNEIQLLIIFIFTFVLHLTVQHNINLYEKNFLIRKEVTNSIFLIFKAWNFFAYIF